MHYYETAYNPVTGQHWIVERFPLIWVRSDNSGILPDPKGRSRRVYETALFGHGGGRQMVRAISNLVPALSDQLSRMSAKSESLLHHLFRVVLIRRWAG